jgi:hypothetical protein|tara:strand:+ start:384 stop:2084 length:1701 start_codon:yes stop_codon:yes gene_type:complete
MLNIFFSSIVSTIILLSYGSLFNNFFFKKNFFGNDFYYSGLYGFILIGFIGVLVNFFLPINLFVGNIFLIFSIIIFIKLYYSQKEKIKFIFLIIFISTTTFLLVTLSNINRPDAGLYHLPYINFLQENKIILGLTNIHYRFGHTSIFQYISAIYNNSLFEKEFITIPLASLFSFFLVFLLDKFKKFLDSKKEINKIFTFFLLIFSIYSFNRYSNYGNDAPANIFFFILLIALLDINNLKSVNFKTFFNISILTIFLTTLKPMMIITLILPLILFLINKNKFDIIKNRNALLCFVLISLWLVKNLLLSGCFIFPLKTTCITKLDFYNESITIKASLEAEAWSKGYPNSQKKTNYENYISEFKWIKTWLDNHFKIIIEKILPIFILILLFFRKKIFSINFYKKELFRNISRNKNNIFIITFLLFCCVIWFLKFPVYRFGLAFISSFILLTSIILFTNEKSKLYNKKFYYIFISIGLLAFYLKNLDRIIHRYDVYYNNYPWPKIYTMKNNEKNLKKEYSKIYDKNQNFLYYFSGGEECMFNTSPCSNFISKNLKLEQNKYYKKYFIIRN